MRFIVLLLIAVLTGCGMSQIELVERDNARCINEFGFETGTTDFLECRRILAEARANNPPQFSENPLGAIGYVMTSTSEGMRPKNRFECHILGSRITCEED